MFEEDNSATEDIFDNFPNKDDNTTANFYDTFNCFKDKWFYTYRGSLTQPPCTTRVAYLINRSPMKIKPDTLKRFQDGINGGKPNNRPVQDVESRAVFLLNQDKDICNQYNLLK